MGKRKIIQELIEDALDNNMQQISGQDATFLYGESPTSPMQIGSLTIVEGSLEFDEFKRLVASKLHQMPKFRKRLVNVPMNLDYPYWVDDPNFNIDLHLNHFKLPDPSNWKTLREITSNIFSRSLDLRRPLWSIDFIEGVDEIPQLPKGSVAIVTRVHHVMIDGASGVGIMGLLFDKDKADKDKPIRKPRRYDPEPLPDELSLLAKSSYNFLKDPLKFPKLVGEAAFELLKSSATPRITKKAKFNTSEHTVPKTIFNGSVSPKRTWGTAILEFDRINALRNIMGVSINDLIVAMCAGAIRRYLIDRNKLPSQPLVANVPISIRTGKEEEGTGNKISNMLVRIGTHIEDPIKRLEFINEQTEMKKHKHKAVGAKSLMKMAESVPFGLANLAAGVYSRYNVKEFIRPPFNVTITNVPGPNQPLYLRGHKIVSVFGLTPVLDGFGLIIAAFSYNGQVSITATSDANTMPDADKFARYIREGANELEKLIKQRGKQKTTEKKKTFKSASFFRGLKRYLKTYPKNLKLNKGTYEFAVSNDAEIAFWTLDNTQEELDIRKKKSTKPKVTVNITDDNLVALHKKQLLLEELKIQGRIKCSGKDTDVAKMLQLLSQFLNS